MPAPRSTLQRRATNDVQLTDLRVESCSRSDVKDFVEKWHYSQSINGVNSTLCFRVVLRGAVVGAAIFGAPGMPQVAAKYSNSGKYHLLELRRFVMIDDLPPNNESYVLARMLKMCKDAGIDRILSYADPSFGHQGIIYQATGFKNLGTTGARNDVVWNGKKYPRRNLGQVHRPFHKELNEALRRGEAQRVRTPGKIIYVKDLVKPWELARRA